MIMMSTTEPTKVKVLFKNDSVLKTIQNFKAVGGYQFSEQVLYLALEDEKKIFINFSDVAGFMAEPLNGYVGNEG